jgi:hypothetical protein
MLKAKNAWKLFPKKDKFIFFDELRNEETTIRFLDYFNERIVLS